MTASIAVRQAVLSTVMMLVAVAALALATRTTVLREQRAAILRTVDTDIAGLVDGMASGGIVETRRRIVDRMTFPGDPPAYYFLADAHGRLIAGSVLGMMGLDANHSQAAEIDTAHGPLLARATRLTDGSTLVVARSLAPTQRLARRLLALFLLASLPAALLSLIVAGWSAARLQNRVSELNAVFDRFRRGARAARAASPQADELGQLSAHVNAHLEQMNALIDAQREIGDNIAHELRTPLGHLDARLISALEANDLAAIQHHLQRARADIRDIVALFEALLELAAVETRSGLRGGTQFDLSERLADLADLYEASAEELDVRFSACIEPDVIMHGEPMAISRAVANLLDNAFSVTAPGNHVRLTLATGPTIVVEDDGPGVPSEVRARIFERFRGARPIGTGHGLGLALVRVIAARHDLRARCEDARPGCRFILAPDHAE